MKNVVFDIDDTIIDETGFLLKHAPFYLKKKGFNAKVVNQNGYNVAEVFGLAEYFIKTELDHESVSKKCNEVTTDFWNKHFVKYCLQPLKPLAREFINNLYHTGYNVYFVSLRGKKYNYNEETKMDSFIRVKVVPFLTKLQLSLNRVKYTELHLVKDTEEKLEYIKNVKADYVFEDQLNIINKIDEKIKVFCVSCTHNLNVEIPDNVTRIDSYKNIPI